MPMPPSGAARPSFSVSNSAPASPPTFKPVDHLADRADGLDQAPEGAEQAEKHQQAGHVAGDVAGFVEPGGDGIQQMPHGLLRDRHPPGALAAEDRGHRRQQLRPPLDRKPGIGDAEIVDPGDFRIEPDHLAERQDDADQQHRADQRVEAGIGEERENDLLVEHDCDQRAEHQEHQHPHQEDPWRGQFVQFDLHVRSGRRGLRALTVSSVAKEPFSAANMAQRGWEKSSERPEFAGRRNFVLKAGFDYGVFCECRGV